MKAMLLRTMSAQGVVLVVVMSLVFNGCHSMKPDFCSEVAECFNFSIACNTTDYEVRLYPSSIWVGTRVIASYTRAQLTAFWRLLSYIQGKNENGLKIDMTAPVITKVPLGIDVEKEYTIYFLIPAVHQTNPPMPSSPDVFLTRFPEMVVYVRSFGGWIMNSNRDLHSQALAASLQENKENINLNYYFTAVYNSAMKLFNRHNEIWYRGYEEPECG